MRISKKSTLLLSGAASALAATGAIIAFGVAAPASGSPSAQGPPPNERVWSTSVTGGSAPAARIAARSASPSAKAIRAAGAIDAENPDLELDTGQARTAAAPSETGGAWTVVPGSGGACVVLSDGGTLCGSDGTFERSGAAISWTKPPPTMVNEVPPGELPGPEDSVPATTGDVVIDGLAVDEVVRAEVLDRYGDVIGSTDVSGSIFSLTVPVAQKPNAVRIVGADGGSSIILLNG